MPSELDVMSIIDKHLSEISDAVIRERILYWAWAKFGSSEPTKPFGLPLAAPKGSPKVARKVQGGSTTSKSKPTSLSLLKDLNLKPQGKKSFMEFAAAKQPSSHYEKCLVAAYYLRTILGIDQISADHVFTCFKVAGWRVPADLKNTMQVAASTRGWLDTKSVTDIKVTIHGDNYVEHDLPAKKE
jgi:hypothetical protein